MAVSKKAEWGLFGFKTLATLAGLGLTVYLFRRRQKATELDIQIKQAQLEQAQQGSAVDQAKQAGVDYARQGVQSLMQRL